MPQNHSICIVDDDEVYKFFVKKILKIKKLAENVLTFPDGEEAYNYIEQNKENPEKLPDIIFLDINMPIMDGFQFMEEYTKLKAKVAKKITIRHNSLLPLVHTFLCDPSQQSVANSCDDLVIAVFESQWSELARLPLD